MKDKIGSYIKVKRLENKLTQEELCEAICAPSYLSRIENNQVVAEKSIYTLLLKKMGITYEDVHKNNEDLNERIENWYCSMIERKDNSENIYELIQRINQTIDEDIIKKFNIVYSRHLLIKGKIDKASEILSKLKRVIMIDDCRNYFLYINILMVYYHIKEEYIKALETGFQLEKLFNIEKYASDYELGVFNYNLALNFSKINQNESCIYFSKIANKIFNDNYSLDRSIDCQILLGTSYNRLGYWEKSIKAYTLSKKILYVLSYDSKVKYSGIISNNLGYTYELQGEFEQAIHYYVESLEYKTNANERLRTIINLVRCNNLNGNHDSAKQWLQLGYDSLTEDTLTSIQLKLRIYSLLLNIEKATLDTVIELQSTSINYFSKNQNWRMVCEYAEIFASLFEQFKAYKRANQMYKLILSTSKKVGVRNSEKNNFSVYHNNSILSD